MGDGVNGGGGRGGGAGAAQRTVKNFTEFIPEIPNLENREFPDSSSASQVWMLYYVGYIQLDLPEKLVNRRLCGLCTVGFTGKTCQQTAKLVYILLIPAQSPEKLR